MGKTHKVKVIPSFVTSIKSTMTTIMFLYWCYQWLLVFARLCPIKEGKTARGLLIVQSNKLKNTLTQTLHDVLNQDIEKIRVQSSF
jgi:hypothetical protein